MFTLPARTHWLGQWIPTTAPGTTVLPQKINFKFESRIILQAAIIAERSRASALDLFGVDSPEFESRQGMADKE